MVTNKTPPKAARWYAPDQKAESRLLAAGADTRHIYRAWKGEVPGKFKMRRGEYLGVVDGLRAFGPGKKAIKEAVDAIHADGASVLDIETGQDSRNDGVAMATEASSPRKLSPEARRLMGEEQAEKHRKKNGQMLKREAYAVWKNPNLSVEEKAEITRWSKSALYAAFKASGAPAGRRPKHLQKA